MIPRLSPFGRFLGFLFHRRFRLHPKRKIPLANSVSLFIPKKELTIDLEMRGGGEVVPHYHAIPAMLECVYQILIGLAQYTIE